jgi:hypothetical protein
MSRSSRIMMAVAVGLGVAACAGGLPRETAHFGPAADLEATLARAAPLIVELGQPAYVLALGVTYPSAEEPGRPVTFDAQYPRFPTDARHFDAGQHRLKARQRPPFWPMNCGRDEVPTIDGCRRPLHLLPGISGYVAARHPRSAVLIIASAEFVDPFTLAEELYWELMRDWQRTQRLIGADVEVLTEEIEPLLVRTLGRDGWAASFGVTF